MSWQRSANVPRFGGCGGRDRRTEISAAGGEAQQQVAVVGGEVAHGAAHAAEGLAVAQVVGRVVRGRLALRSSPRRSSARSTTTMKWLSMRLALPAARGSGPCDRDFSKIIGDMTAEPDATGRRRPRAG